MAATVDVFNTSRKGGVEDPFNVPVLIASSCHTGGNPPTASSDFTNQTPVNTEIYVCEIRVEGPIAVTGISFFNGATISTDSRHAALIDKDGNAVPGTATGAVLLSGTDAYDQVPFTGGKITLNGPAVYFVAHIMSGATVRLNAHAVGDFIAGTITGATYGAIGNLTLPTGFTADVGPVASFYE